MKKVFLTMCADPVHHGHINIIQKAMKHGDEIIVGLLTDEAITEYKKPPLIGYEQRKIVVENIKGVSRVVAQKSGLDYTENLLMLKPDFVVHGDDWKTGPLAPVRSKVIETLKEWDGVLVDVPYTEGICSNDLRSKIHSNTCAVDKSVAFIK